MILMKGMFMDNKVDESEKYNMGYPKKSYALFGFRKAMLSRNDSHKRSV